MWKQKQRWLHGEDGHMGDCYRTAIACYLGVERDSVPHFVEEYENDAEKVSRGVGSWLRERGLGIVEVPVPGELTFEDVVGLGRSWFNGIDRLIIGGVSVRGTNHVVVWDEADGVWDPSRLCGDDPRLRGPQVDQEGVTTFWWIIVILPLRRELGGGEANVLAEVSS